MSLSRAVVSLAFGALLASPLAGRAHEVVPADWCIKEKEAPKIVARFEFDGPQLHELMNKCGIVEKEDNWATATETIVSYCKIVAPLKDAVPFVLGPKEYLDGSHHERYRLDQGLSGACAVCPPKP